MSYNPLANVAAPPQPQGGTRGSPQNPQNPLATLAGPLPGPPAPPQQPAPTRAQAVAAVRRLTAVQNAMREVMQSPGYGRTNIRPALLDAASKLIGSRLLSLPEVMNSISGVPDDPVQQKDFVSNIYNSAQRAAASVLDHHGSAVATGKLPPNGGDKYDPDKHEQHFNGAMSHYQSGG
jgi:hypothetical protein